MLLILQLLCSLLRGYIILNPHQDDYNTTVAEFRIFWTIQDMMINALFMGMLAQVITLFYR